MTKHTPGPWIIHPMNSSRTGLDAGWRLDYPWHIVPASHASRPIGGSVDKDYDRATYACQICTFNDFARFEREEVQANARLIAAAPELLKVLIKVSKHLAYGDPLLDEVDSAIHKAVTGEPWKGMRFQETSDEIKKRE